MAPSSLHRHAFLLANDDEQALLALVICIEAAGDVPSVAADELWDFLQEEPELHPSTSVPWHGQTQLTRALGRLRARGLIESYTLDTLDRRLVWKPLTDGWKLLHERMLLEPDAR